MLFRSREWEEEAKKRGLLNLTNSVDAYKLFDDEKNVKLFTDHGVMSRTEIVSRKEILFENYAKIVNIEALTMIEMASREIIPAVNAYLGEVASTAATKRAVSDKISCAVEEDILVKLSDLNTKAYEALGKLKKAEEKAAKVTGCTARAEAYRDLVLPVMAKLRKLVDEMETMTSSEYWPMPTYGDMMFKI